VSKSELREVVEEAIFGDHQYRPERAPNAKKSKKVATAVKV